MNKLFTFAGAADIRGTSNHRKLLEFYELDKQIAERYDKVLNDWLDGKKVKLYNKHIDNEPKVVKQWSPYKDLELAILTARAKNILKDLKIL